MFVSDVNDVKIFNLSAGKSLPDVSLTISLKFISHVVFLVAHRPKKEIGTEQECRFAEEDRAYPGFRYARRVNINPNVAGQSIYSRDGNL